LCAHTILLGLEGVPAFYIHSLLGTRNDRDGVIQSGINRRINRRQWKAHELNTELDDENSPHANVLKKLLHRIGLRQEQRAFHPNATQFTLHMGDQIFAFWRQSMDRRSSVFCLNNVSNEEQRIPVASINLISTEEWLDLISGDILEDEEGDIILAPYQCVWLANRRKHLPY
jgi:sucrose phosphorylase